MDDRELYRDLSRMIRGELSSVEVQRIVKREGVGSFAELCEQRLPEDLAKVRIGTREILTRIDRYRRRQLPLYELWFWADELWNISINHRISFEARTEELVTTALSALSVIANEGLFPNVAKTQRALEYIRACLLRRRKLQLRNVFMRIFEDVEVAHLAVKQGSGPEAPPEGSDERRWADVVFLDRPFQEGGDLFADYNWMIAFTVTAKSLYEQERAGEGGDVDENGEWICPDCAAERRRREEGGPEPAEPEEAGPPAPSDFADPIAAQPFSFSIPGWSDAEDDADEAAALEAIHYVRERPTPRPPGDEHDRAPALKRLVPNFNFARYSPKYLCDGDGIAEIVLDAPAIGPAEIEYAAKLWCLANRIRDARLEGRKLKALIVKPGAGKRAG